MNASDRTESHDGGTPGFSGSEGRLGEFLKSGFFAAPTRPGVRARLRHLEILEEQLARNLLLQRLPAGPVPWLPFLESLVGA